MQKYLVPVDSSDNALRALNHAIRLAGPGSQASLHIVTVHEPPQEFLRSIAYQSLDAIERMLRTNAEAALAPALQQVRAAGVAATSEVLSGDIAKCIVAAGEAQGCTGIIMGTRGMGAVGNLVLGSIATKVIHLTTLPVTLVK